MPFWSWRKSLGSVCHVTSRRVGESLASWGSCGSGEGLSGNAALGAGEEFAGSVALDVGEAVVGSGALIADEELVGSTALIFGEGLSGRAASVACAKAWLGTHKLQAHKITIMKDCLNTDFIDSFGCASLIAGKSEK